MLEPMRFPTSSRAAGLALVVVLTTSLTACTHDDDTSPEPTSSTSPSDTTTANAPQFEKSNAHLDVAIKQMGGGVRKSHRKAIKHAIAKPIKAWMYAAYLEGDFPRGHYNGKSFPGWTSDAAHLAKKDKDITTNAAVSSKVVGVVADKRTAALYVFAVGGLTGGATARIHLKMTAAKENGDRISFVVAGELYLTRKADHWHIFGYDLHRTVMR
jgi:hypothetical protein